MNAKMAKAKKQIVQSGNDTHETHRVDFQTCPNCGHEMKHEAWSRTATVLVLHPKYYKAGAVSVISECPKCFRPSWVHVPMTSLRFSNFPESWKNAAARLDAQIRLSALRQWGAAICHRCKHLKGGNVEYHAWRTCILGTGPAMHECSEFSELGAKKS